MTGHPARLHPGAFLLSLCLHLVLLGLLLTRIEAPEPLVSPAQPEIIEAVAVDAAGVDHARQRVEKQRQQRLREQQAAAARERELEAQARRRADDEAARESRVADEEAARQTALKSLAIQKRREAEQREATAERQREAEA
ncbi:MAG: hypothetical protein LUO80_03945, partial [Methylococcaceae bacterium]|nr:hypothetical protein [Methylococcaceae bacterium]